MQPFEFSASYHKLITMKNLILPLLLILTLVFSCRSESDEVLEKKVNSYDVYVAGVENNEACYWKNTVQTVLMGGTGFGASYVVFDNSDMYVVGSKHNNFTGPSHFCYWKNNIKYNIEQILGLLPINDFRFNDIIFKNGDVHILGSIKNPASTSAADAYQLCYWKNGVKTVIEAQHSEFISIFGQNMIFFNNDLYITSSKNYNPVTNAYDLGYYKNGNYNLVSNTNNRRMRQFFNDSSNLFLITEGDNNVLERYNLATSIFSSLPSFITYSNFRTILKDGSDTYYTGGDSYYKNNNLVTLPNNTGGYIFFVDFKVVDENTYLIRHRDSGGIVGQKVFVNNIETQSIISQQSSGNYTNSRFHSLTVVSQ